MNINSLILLIYLQIIIFYPFEQSFSQVTNTEANYNFEIENFDIALKQYLKFYKKDKENPLYNYRIGVCYLNTDINKPLAIPYLNYSKCLFEEKI